MSMSQKAPNVGILFQGILIQGLGLILLAAK